jgi:N4-gp56 family major capsid protein
VATTISATDTEVQKPINAIMEQTLLRNAQSRAPYFMGTMPGSLIRHGGSATAKWRRFNTSLDNASGPAPSTTALTELTTTASYMQGRDSITAHLTDVTATVAKYGQFYILNEEVDVLNFNHTTDGLMRTLGIIAGRSLNQLQRNVGEDNATEVFAGGVASEGGVLASVVVGDLDAVILTLNGNSAITFTAMTAGSQNVGTTPILPSYWAICHPHVAYDISKLTGFKSVETYGQQTATAMGEFGMYQLAGQGLRFIQTEDASVTAGGGGATGSTGNRGATNLDTYSILIYGQEAIGSVGLGQTHPGSSFMAGDSADTVEIIVKDRASGGTSDPYEEIMTMAYKFWHTGAVLNANWTRSLVVAATSV